MTITTPGAYTLDDGDWVRGTFIVTLGDAYSTYKDALAQALKDEGSGSNQKSTPALDDNVRTVLNGDAAGDDGPTPAYMSRRKCRDTSLGGNDAINCYPQYNEDDDIIHPFTSVSPDLNGIGLGRVYSEAIDDAQQILYMSAGVQVFNSLSAFYNLAMDQDLATLVNQGTGTMDKIGRFFGYVVNKVFLLPTIPLLYLQRLTQGSETAQITKYYDFKSQMPLYYRAVQLMLIQIGTNMGMMTDANLSGQTAQAAGQKNVSATAAESNLDTNSSGLPDFVGRYQFDIYQIILKRYQYERGGKSIKVISSDEALEAQLKDASTQAGQAQTQAQQQADAASGSTAASGVKIEKSWLDAFLAAYGQTLYDANLFVGFKVERGVDTSEALSNTVGQMPIENLINSNVTGVRNATFSAMNGNTGFGAVDGVISAITNGFKDAAAGFGDVTGLKGIAAMATGAGMIDIPEVWQDSSFSKNYSFHMKLRSPYGDPYSIIQRIYVPLCMLLGMALPRGTGQASYSSPFLVRAYCKGMFAVPMGIIDSFNISRGGDQFGWSISRLPTAVDVSFTIRDLSPSMYMSMGGIKDMMTQIMGTDSTMSEYLMTLSGMGLTDRVFTYKKKQRQMQILKRSFFDAYFNNFQLGMEMGQASPVRFITNIMPSTRLSPDN